MQKMAVTVLDGTRITIGLYTRSADDHLWALQESRSMGEAAVNGQIDVHVPVEWQPLTHGCAMGVAMRSAFPASGPGTKTIRFA